MPTVDVDCGQGGDAQGGQGGGWEGLDGLRKQLHRYLLGRCRDDSEAEDLIQETFVRAARYRSGLVRPERLRSWVLRIASNVLHDHVRRSSQGRVQGMEDDQLDELQGSEPSPCDTRPEDWFDLDGDLVERELLLGELSSAFRTLEGTDRAVLSSYYGGDQSCAATAVECGLSPTLVKVRLFRARRRLESALRRRIARRAGPC